MNFKYSLQFLDSVNCDYFPAVEENVDKNGYQFLNIITIWTEAIAPLQQRGSQT